MPDELLQLTTDNSPDFLGLTAPGGAYEKALTGEGVVVGVGAAPSLPLSCQGQARRLIEEAVSRSNLGRMYVWWMSWN